jgi:RNA polymerase sigma factor (TIGR02999 family)
MESRNEISELLRAWSDGEQSAFEELFPLVTFQLRQIAHAQMRCEGNNHILQTTALVNEAYLKLNEQNNVRWKNRSHFFAITSKVMRRILLDHAKARLRDKRGAGVTHVELMDAEDISFEKSMQLIALDEALELLAKIDPIKSQVVEMRHFGGMTVEETAEALGIAPVTVMRYWSLAKAWLHREITS